MYVCVTFSFHGCRDQVFTLLFLYFYHQNSRTTSKNSETGLIVHTLKPPIRHVGHDLITSDAPLQTAVSFIARASDVCSAIIITLM